MSVYQYSVTDMNGKEVLLKAYEGKVLLIVNTATECGFTPHYQQLQEMYSELNGKGLEIIDIPCNQFGHQTPGSDEEVHQFCTSRFGVTFSQMHKSDVNGENELPLYTYLKSEKGFAGFTGEKAEFMNNHIRKIDPDFENNANIKWNFTKFIVDRAGNVVARFEPTADMSEVKAFIETLL